MRAGLLACLLALSACEGRETDAESTRATTGAARAVSAPTPGAEAGQSSWALATTGTGSALVLTGSPPPGNTPVVLRLACLADTNEMAVIVEGVAPIGSEDRLTLGLDNQPQLFVADLGAGGPNTVEARAPITQALLSKLASARRISVNYGAWTLGPVGAPFEDLRPGFLRACSEAARG